MEASPGLLILSMTVSKGILISTMYFFMFFFAEENPDKKELTYYRQAIIRGDTTRKQIALVFTGDLYADGGEVIFRTLAEKNIMASFFLTGNFYRNASFRPLIAALRKQGHYLGAHSDKHLLYCSWENRDSLLITKSEFQRDFLANYAEMRNYGIGGEEARYFLPPYEWYNDSIAVWTNELGFKLVNFSPGTLSHADYTIPAMSNYRSNDTIFESITTFERNSSNGLNGFILLLHLGVDPRRTDKFYDRLGELIDYLQNRNYALMKIDVLLAE